MEQSYFELVKEKRFHGVDISFHDAVVQASHNQLSVAIWHGIRKIVEHWIRIQSQAKVLPEGMKTHRKIYEAIACRNRERAREAMREHMEIAATALSPGEVNIPSHLINED
jgi:DNA-binding FadR family transcriptional regulator